MNFKWSFRVFYMHLHLLSLSLSMCVFHFIKIDERCHCPLHKTVKWNFWYKNHISRSLRSPFFFSPSTSSSLIWWENFSSRFKFEPNEPSTNHHMRKHMVCVLFKADNRNKSSLFHMYKYRFCECVYTGADPILHMTFIKNALYNPTVMRLHLADQFLHALLCMAHMNYQFITPD